MLIFLALYRVQKGETSSDLENVRVRLEKNKATFQRNMKLTNCVSQSGKGFKEFIGTNSDPNFI